MPTLAEGCMEVILFCFEHECTLKFSQIVLKFWLPLNLEMQFRFQFLRVYSITHLIRFFHTLAMPARGYRGERSLETLVVSLWRKTSGGYVHFPLQRKVFFGLRKFSSSLKQQEKNFQGPVQRESGVGEIQVATERRCIFICILVSTYPHRHLHALPCRRLHWLRLN
jgi:hypothetical protein